MQNRLKTGPDKSSITVQGLLFSGNALIWTARTCPRFETTRPVASKESRDASPHSKSRHCLFSFALDFLGAAA